MKISFHITIFCAVSVLCLLTSVGVNAQSVDFKSRVGAEVEYELSQSTTVSLGMEGRFRGNSSIFEKVLAEPSISYDLSNAWRVGAVWRTELKQSLSRELAFKHRAAVYLRYKFEIDDFDLKLKSTIQYGVGDLSSFSDMSNKLVSRNSLNVSYNWFGKKIKPFAEYEFHTHLNNVNGAIVNQSRYSAGASYRIKKGRELELFYKFEDEMNVADPVDSHNLGLIFKFSL